MSFSRSSPCPFLGGPTQPRADGHRPGAELGGWLHCGPDMVGRGDIETHIETHACLHIHAHLYTHIYTHICADIHRHTYAHIVTHIHAYIYIYTHIHTYINIYTRNAVMCLPEISLASDAGNGHISPMGCAAHLEKVPKQPLMATVKPL